MQALHFDKTLRLIQQKTPKAQKDEALIQVILAGICQTDLEIIKGYMNFNGILGHEFVGKVIDSPSDKTWLGKRVVGEISIGCGHCEYCLKGLARHCPSRSTMGILNQEGCFSEQIVLPLKNLIPVPDEISNEEAVFIEPLAAACEILEQVHIEPNYETAIIGDGRLAQLVARVLVLTGCKVTLIGKHPEKLRRVDQKRIQCFLLNDLPSRKFDIVIEASGSPLGFQTALNLTKPRGVMVLKSTYEGNAPINLAQVVIDEISIVGSRCGQFIPAIRLLKDKKVAVKDLISQIYPIDEFDKAFQQAKSSKTLKTILEIQ